MLRLKTQVECRLSKRLRSQYLQFVPAINDWHRCKGALPNQQKHPKLYGCNDEVCDDEGSKAKCSSMLSDSQKRSMSDYEQLLEGLKKVLSIAKANGNTLFIDNIERDIKALEAGEESPIIKEYLTPEERVSNDSEKEN